MIIVFRKIILDAPVPEKLKQKSKIARNE